MDVRASFSSLSCFIFLELLLFLSMSGRHPPLLPLNSSCWTPAPWRSRFRCKKPSTTATLVAGCAPPAPPPPRAGQGRRLQREKKAMLLYPAAPLLLSRGRAPPAEAGSRPTGAGRARGGRGRGAVEREGSGAAQIERRRRLPVPAAGGNGEGEEEAARWRVG